MFHSFRDVTSIFHFLAKSMEEEEEEKQTYEFLTLNRPRQRQRETSRRPTKEQL
jgi:hypothetical protein